MDIHIYVGDTYSFFQTFDPDSTIQQLVIQAQQQLNSLFCSKNGKAIKILSVMNEYFSDLPLNQKINDVLYQQAPVLLLIDYIDQIDSQHAKLLTIHPQQATIITTAVNKQLSQEEKENILKSKQIPDINIDITIHSNDKQYQHQQSQQQSQKHTSQQINTHPQCTPYCQPLAPFGVNNQICPICGNVKAYCPTNTEKCTSLCKTGEIQKLKAHNIYRQQKYTHGCIHQCIRCHRPWLQLSKDLYCRTCFQIVNKGKGEVFRPVETRVITDQDTQNQDVYKESLQQDQIQQ